MTINRFIKYYYYIFIILIIMSHTIMLSYNSIFLSPTMDEIGHMPAGISHWQYGMYDLYRVNPPFPRMVATLPVILCRPNTDWSNYQIFPFSRETIPMGVRFAKANGSRTFLLFAVGRLACIPFSLLGACMIWVWGTRLWGSDSGLACLIMWCFNPMIVGHAALIMPDVPAASMGLTATFLFGEWLRFPSWRRCIWAGLTLGIAETCKTTLLVLFLIWPTAWLINAIIQRRDRVSILYEFMHIIVMFILSIYIINLVYLFNGTMIKLSNYSFVSSKIGGHRSDEGHRIRNVYKNYWVGSILVPFPKDYIQGIDRQCADFEEGWRSYLCGNWKNGGWWYYYLLGLTIKTPIGLMAIMLIAVAMSIRNVCNLKVKNCFEEWFVLSSGVTILGLVSSEVGFSKHVRYAIPALPFLILWCSKPASSKHIQVRYIFWMLIASYVASSVAVYPDSIAYFNEYVGGPKNGHMYMLDSNSSWGQDLIRLKGWVSRHPEARPLHLATCGWVDPGIAGIDFKLPLVGPRYRMSKADPRELSKVGPAPGWFVIDVNLLHGTELPVAAGNWMWWNIGHNSMNFEYFNNFKSIDSIGGSYKVYKISINEANNLRVKLGLPILTDRHYSESEK